VENTTLVLAVLALLVFVGMALEELFRRTGIPDVLVLLGIGVVAGATGFYDVEAARGLDRVFITIALVLLLFEGAIQLRVSDLRRGLGSGLLLTLLGFFATMIAVGAVATVFMGMEPLAGLLLGAILGGTSSGVIAASLRLSRETWTVLSLESSLGDVLCIVFSLALAGALTSGTVDVTGVGLSFGVGVVGALVLGAALGLVWAFGLRALRERRVSSVALAAAVFLVYAISEALGLYSTVSCLAFGVVLANAPAISHRGVASDDLAPAERLFLAEIAFVLKTFFFVHLGATLHLAAWQPWVFGLLATAAIFAVRPLVVRLGLSRTTTPRRDAIIASVLVPQGLASAVLAGVPARMGVEDGPAIEAAAVGAILITIASSSLLVFAADKRVVRRVWGRFFGSYLEDPRLPAVYRAPSILPMPDAQIPADASEQPTLEEARKGA